MQSLLHRHLTDCLLIIDLTFPQQWVWIFSSEGKTPVGMRLEQHPAISRPASIALEAIRSCSSSFVLDGRALDIGKGQ